MSTHVDDRQFPTHEVCGRFAIQYEALAPCSRLSMAESLLPRAGSDVVQR